MKVFTVFEHLGAQTPDPEAILVKEGMAWWALPFPLLWFLYHREWNWALAFFMAALLFGMVTGRFFPDAGPETGILGLGINLLAGLFGNELRQISLRARGFVEGPVIVAEDHHAAEQRYFRERHGGYATGMTAS